MSKAFDDLKEYLDEEGLNYSDDTMGSDTEIVYFGVRGDNQMSLLFMVENAADVVQFRVMYVLDDDDKEKLKQAPEHYLALLEYLLLKNSEYKLGKWTFDHTDYDLYFTISQFVETGNGLEKALFKRAKKMIWDDVDEMIGEIKSIVETGEAKPVDTDDLASMLKKLSPEDRKKLLGSLDDGI